MPSFIYVRPAYESKSLKTAARKQDKLRGKARQTEIYCCYVFYINNELSNLNVIGEQVRKLRERKGWSQDEFAVKLQLFGWDTSQDSVSRLENQIRRVTDLELFILCNVLSAKFEDFFPANLKNKVKSFGPHFRAKLSRGQVPPTPKE